LFRYFAKYWKNEYRSKKFGVNVAFFSGNKIFALQGSGVLFVSKNLHAKIKNFFSESQNTSKIFEIESLNILGILSLGGGIDFINSIGVENIHSYLIDLTQYLILKLKELENINFLPGYHQFRCVDGYGILSFSLENLSSKEIKFLLNDFEIDVRTG